MDKQSIFFTVLVAVIATVLMQMAIQFLAKKQKIQPNSNEQGLPLSLTIWNISLLIPFFLYLKTAILILENTIEILISPKCPENAFLGVIQRIAIYIGFTFLFTFLAYYLIGIILKINLGKRIDSIEIDNNNYGYFLIKGVLMIFISFVLLDTFEHLLNWFAPIIETPFYH
ncbi:hypothetical protein [Flavobacterium eburneipallidum]|uniref:hypothetical protein n=1 Tax=Flavobacterium eburneipallidum TaxID=3003263 RepID=UPI0024828062|nr:hypothetical protein [Flavobacterium eburneipallidum]